MDPKDKKKQAEMVEEGPAQEGETNSANGKDSAEDTFDRTSAEEREAQLRVEIDSLRDKMLRNAAEFDNFKKRRKAEVVRLQETAAQSVVSLIIPVLDDMELFIQNVPNAAEVTQLVTGAQMIYQKMFEALKKSGVELIEAEGNPFDPEQHEALFEQPTKDAEPGTVIGVHQNGYTLNGRLLRPSKVIVAKAIEMDTE